MNTKQISRRNALILAIKSSLTIAMGSMGLNAKAEEKTTNYNSSRQLVNNEISQKFSSVHAGG